MPAQDERQPTRPWPDPEWDRVSPWPPSKPPRTINKVALASSLLATSGLIYVIALAYTLFGT